MTQKCYYLLICSTQNARIKSIINLQTPGEHASCGPNLQQANGFTYDPNEFMSQDIFYYNFAWKDYGEASSMSGLLDMVKVRTVLFDINHKIFLIHGCVDVFQMFSLYF